MPSNIIDLPIELIDLIFGHLTMANDRRRTAQVCKLFNKVIRNQSIRNRNNTLRLDEPLSEESPFRVFENWKNFPFSKLIFGQTWIRNIVLESDFWTLYGHEISEISIHIGKNFSNLEISLLSILRSYFPNLKKLRIEGSSEGSSINDVNISPNVQNTLNCSLPIEELCLSSINSAEADLTFLRCSPHLKKLEMIHTVNLELLPKILPWLESVESSILHVNLVEISINNFINLPSHVVIGELTIEADEKPEMIREFFKRPRMIEKLFLEQAHYNPEFNEDEEEGENNPELVYFNRVQVEALRGAKSIKKVKLPTGVLDFGGSLDLLAQLPGIESISLNLTCPWYQPDQLYPLYWSSPDTTKKITEIWHRAGSPLNYLDGLCSLTTFSVSSDDINSNGLSGDEIQHLIRNCPNLKSLYVPKILANDADLIGTGGLLPFSSLEKLEILHIRSAPNITSEALRSAFKFPNLKTFSMPYFSEEPLNQHDAQSFTQNFPNVSKLYLINSINKEAFVYLIRNLPYLRKNHIGKKDRYLLSEEKVKELKKEFPYLNIGIRTSTKKD